MGYKKKKGKSVEKRSGVANRLIRVKKVNLLDFKCFKCITTFYF